ncbi:carboxymuconolactone decarboxylase family protein [Bacillus atrophaeus]|nr:carboxymuconolactone decarboxylase family protein [Bacillus atrophaeus]MCY8931411.1 carboxymuconolactone decarboxylase family protein [Bacillus atrophaeus]MCY8941997.1 carboxymuconolactone decarboxylase family protein [Bacillus atrophaeus]MCY8947572.1 carboxymuconolactone decarboxylase family protein [Bacillus atrophaeus]
MEGYLLTQYNESGNMQNALKQYKEGLGTFQQKMPMMGRKFNEFTEQCFEANSLTEKEKQLIALGISIHAQDEYCMIYHTKGCIDQGATEENILETVSVAAAFGGGAALSQGVTVVQQCIQEFGSTTH